MTIPQAGSVVSGRGKGFLSAVTSAGTHREATPGSVNDMVERGSEEGKGVVFNCIDNWPHQGQLTGEEGVPTFPRCPVSRPAGREQLLGRPRPAKGFRAACPGMAGVYQRVVATGVPNYRGARVPLGHAIRAEEWRKWSHIHGDASLPDMLEYGFPCGFVGRKQPATGLSNHASAMRNPKQVEAFLRKECSLGAMLGPFKREPFVEWWRNNPLMTRPKRNSTDLRVILDLSFPAEASVNGGIPRVSLMVRISR